MGRLRAAIEAGRRAVAARDAPGGQAVALLAVGLDRAALLAAAATHALAVRRRHGRPVVVADHLPTDLAAVPDLVFEHLPPLADLLSVAAPPEAGEHRLRRLFLILRRWNVSECRWTGGEADELVRRAVDRPDGRTPRIAFLRADA